MKENDSAGYSLIGSTLAGLVTMALHPTAHQVITRGGTMAVVSHSLALAGLPLALFGFLILMRRLALAPNLSLMAYIFYAVGVVAVANAAIFSGFVAPAVAESDVFLHYTGLMNRAFASVDVVASSVAIILWSIALLRVRRWVGVLGIVLSGVILIAFLSGHLRLNIHGFGAIVIAQAIWTLSIAVLLLRGRLDVGLAA